MENIPIDGPAKTVNVTGCHDCPFNYDNYECQHPGTDDIMDTRLHDDKINPLFGGNGRPDWCPLVDSPVIIISTTLGSVSTIVE